MGISIGFSKRLFDKIGVRLSLENMVE